MKQILQDLKTGETRIEDVPCPSVSRGQLLIQTVNTLVSAGTERMLVDFGKANLIDKARQQPDKVKQVLEKIQTDGLAPTLEAVRNKLDTPLPLGYCNVGRVLEVGAGVEGFAVGDLVVSNGKHAEVVAVPKNLCAKIPEGVDTESASFTVIGAIALQGIRLAQPTLGETFVVTGLGLIGLVAVQLLRAHGCRVLGIDFDSRKCALARELGAETVDLSKGEDPLAIAASYSRGRGVDGVIITASTKSNEPVSQAANMCRKRGRIVLVGVVGLELSRADFYEKELSFQVSCSYGPGRYDVEYEEKGNDYPVGFVRWTEQRNFEAILDMLADGRIDAKKLVSHRFPLERAKEAYDLISGGAPLGVILQYSLENNASLREQSITLRHAAVSPNNQVGLGFIGSGNYATNVLIPAFRETGADLRTVSSAQGVSSVHAGKKYGIAQATTDNNVIFQDQNVQGVVITTRHSSHAAMVKKAVESGKSVFVEKPLAINFEQLDALKNLFSTSSEKNNSLLMVGFNRRYAPQIVKMKSLLASKSEPKSLIMTVNAGQIPADHWTQDPESGGGRLIGEGCHFIDLLRHLVGAPIVDASIVGLDRMQEGRKLHDCFAVSLRFADGSMGTVHYLATGGKSFPKERLEVFCAGGILQLDNFRKLRGFNWKGFEKMDLWRQDKGQKSCAKSFVDAIKSGSPDGLIPLEQLFEVAEICIRLDKQLRG
jgi:predicted dehydrogenase/threonine dehydrogenase-like Zn-dependent dehydrogenase